MSLRNASELFTEHTARLGLDNQLQSNLNQKEQGFDYGYWGILPPEKIYIATQSLRKALMVAWILAILNDKECGQLQQDLTHYLPISMPEQLKFWFMANISNGDGAIPLGTELFCGLWRGVQVWIVASGGESPKNNNPELEAMAKALNAERYLDPEVAAQSVVIASDTVEEFGDPPKRHGKPLNDLSYPRKKEGEDDESYQARIEQYNQKYIDDFFHQGELVTHMVSLFAIGLMGFDTQAKETIRLSYKVPENKEGLVVDPESGGAGLTQQFLIRSEQVQNMTPMDVFLKYCQVMGLPLLRMLELAKKVVQEKGERLTFPKDAELVVENQLELS